MPAMYGFICQLPGLKLASVKGSKTSTASLTLMARRSVQRAGTRHWRRGVDMEGEEHCVWSVSAMHVCL